MSATNTKDSSIHATNDADLETWRDFLDLQVQLAIELGRTKLTARAILGLEEDSIVRLPRSTGEGMDVFAGGHRIARAEIIMIEDRTGVRINEVAAQEDNETE